MAQKNKQLKQSSVDLSKDEILKDYETAVISRECSISGKREVLTGKAKFGIFGDGKELPQVAMAYFFFTFSSLS